MKKDVKKFYNKLYKFICKELKNKDINITKVLILPEETVIIEEILNDTQLEKISYHFNNDIIHKEIYKDG